jgi:hypothetical protein
MECNYHNVKVCRCGWMGWVVAASCDYRVQQQWYNNNRNYYYYYYYYYKDGWVGLPQLPVTIVYGSSGISILMKCVDCSSLRQLCTATMV